MDRSAVPMDERRRVRWVIGGTAAVALLVAASEPLVLVVAIPVLAIAVVTEVATTRQWGGFWGEKNPDGTPKYGAAPTWSWGGGGSGTKSNHRRVR